MKLGCYIHTYFCSFLLIIDLLLAEPSKPMSDDIKFSVVNFDLRTKIKVKVAFGVRVIFFVRQILVSLKAMIMWRLPCSYPFIMYSVCRSRMVDSELRSIRLGFISIRLQAAWYGKPYSIIYI